MQEQELATQHLMAGTYNPRSQQVLQGQVQQVQQAQQQVQGWPWQGSLHQGHHVFQ